MKTIYKFSVAVWLILLCVSACKKDDQRIIYEGGTAPQLSVAAGSQVKYADTGQTAVSLAWTNPNYQFNTGVSSLDVSYNLQIDTASDFSSKNRKVISVSKDLQYSFLVEDLNDIMLNQLMLDTNVTYTLYMRVVSNLTNNSAQLVSNTVQ
ncbi:MAG: SusE domain-containing protein, partial [Bacteroidota bacterium]|nr:SusE domain-containing protein [Bacteroidota bacterium]